jgi:hypothetical protein
MPQVQPEYEVNDEFNNMAAQIADKYPDKFNHVQVSQICCVNITNKERKERPAGERCWKLAAVKMPMALHCPYGWYIVLNQIDWDERDEKHKLVLVAECLHGIPEGEDNAGKVSSPDTKGYHAIFNTFGLDCHDDPDIPHILDSDIKWKD